MEAMEQMMSILQAQAVEAPALGPRISKRTPLNRALFNLNDWKQI